MTRSVYLVLFSNGARPAHFALFAPTGDTGNEGKMIHVVGNTALGFNLQFKRNYDFDATRQTYQFIKLADVDNKLLVDTVGDGKYSDDTTARDQFESIALGVQPPGRSSNPFASDAINCQHWVQEYVEKLIEKGYLSSDALSVIQNAPKVISSK